MMMTPLGPLAQLNTELTHDYRLPCCCGTMLPLVSANTAINIIGVLSCCGRLDGDLDPSR